MLKKLKICVYAISKNEEKFIERWMDSVSEADLVVVLDTGSTDNTVERLKQRGAKVYESKIVPWRFDKARNLAMSFIPDDCDICVSNDLDEVFIKGWRKILENNWTEDCTRARYLFNNSFKTDGTPQTQFHMEKIHERNGFEWINPVHEVLKYSGIKADKTIFIKELILNHYPDYSKPRSQYLPLLELSVKENPNDDRAKFWLGREYYYYKKYGLAIETLKEYLNYKTAVWTEERSGAMRFIAMSYFESGDTDSALSWAYRALAECSAVREPYLLLTRIAYKQQNWPLCAAMSDSALRIERSSGSYLVEAVSWGNYFDDMASIANYWLGNYEKSYEHAKRGLKLDSENQRLIDNLNIIEKKLFGAGQ